MFAVVGRNEDDDCVGVEEVDSLQLELEILLASAAKRMRYIHNELSLLGEWIEKGVVTTLPTGKEKAIAAATTSSTTSQQVVVGFKFVMIELLDVVIISLLEIEPEQFLVLFRPGTMSV